MLTELYTIEAALIFMPKGHNIMVVTDSKAAIDIIHHYRSWGPSKQQQHVAQQITLQIHSLINTIKSEFGKNVTFQHIYSHIKNKKAKAHVQGLDAVQVLNQKLELLRNSLHRDLNQWTDTNDEVDKLANKGHNQPPLFSRWAIHSQANPVTLFDG